MNWDKYFLNMCNIVAQKSKDPSTKVGCVITTKDHEVVSTGYNGFPRGVNDTLESRYIRPVKYLFTEHGERNAIYASAKRGIPLDGCILYCNSIPVPFPPCADCARAIIQSGIKEVVFSYKEIPPQWKESCEATLQMFKEAGIIIRSFNESSD